MSSLEGLSNLSIDSNSACPTFTPTGSGPAFACDRVAKVFDLDTRRVVLNCKTISKNGTEIARIGTCAPD
jgi:hypothetical protein